MDKKSKKDLNSIKKQVDESKKLIAEIEKNVQVIEENNLWVSKNASSILNRLYKQMAIDSELLSILDDFNNMSF